MWRCLNEVVKTMTTNATFMDARTVSSSNNLGFYFIINQITVHEILLNLNYWEYGQSYLSITKRHAWIFLLSFSHDFLFQFPRRGGFELDLSLPSSFLILRLIWFSISFLLAFFSFCKTFCVYDFGVSLPLSFTGVHVHFQMRSEEFCKGLTLAGVESMLVQLCYSEWLWC